MQKFGEIYMFRISREKATVNTEQLLSNLVHQLLDTIHPGQMHFKLIWSELNKTNFNYKY